MGVPARDEGALAASRPCAAPGACRRHAVCQNKAGDPTSAMAWDRDMKIALAKSTLLVPPTYFAINHAQLLSGTHEFEFFTLAARLSDPGITVPIRDFVPWHSAPFRWRERAIPLYLPAMSRAIAGYGPDVIHQHFATWSQPAVRAAARTGAPLITTVHGADIAAAVKPGTTAMLRWHHRNIAMVRDQSRRILAVSEYLAGQAIAAGFPPEKVQVHYQGVDTDFFTPDESARRLGNRPQVLFVGTLNEQKGLHDLLRISTNLIGSFEHELVVAGDGPLRAELQAAAVRWPHIRPLGRVGQETVRELLRAAHVLIAPSQEHQGAREAAGLVLLEAQACGTPVLAYRSGGIAEMVPDGGMLVEEGNVPDLQDAVRQVLQQGSEEYARMRHDAREFAVTERSLRKSCAELSSHYEDVVGD